MAAPQQRGVQHCAVEPGEIVSTAVERHRGQARRRGVQLRVVTDAAAQPVRVDEEAILQVLANFLQNGLRFAPVGSEMVVSVTADGANTCFAVADSGPGIPDVDLKSIFEPFEQGQPRKAGSGEVGLGLAISRRIIEEHAGQIWAENRPGGGSRFCFALPAISR